MEKLNQKKFGIAFGLTSIVLYFGCVLIMSILGTDVLIKLSNLLFHGMDFTNIIRADIPILDTLLGALLTFALWSGLGCLFAIIYNKLK